MYKRQKKVIAMYHYEGKCKGLEIMRVLEFGYSILAVVGFFLLLSFVKAHPGGIGALGVLYLLLETVLFYAAIGAPIYRGKEIKRVPTSGFAVTDNGELYAIELDTDYLKVGGAAFGIKNTINNAKIANYNDKIERLAKLQLENPELAVYVEEAINEERSSFGVQKITCFREPRLVWAPLGNHKMIGKNPVDGSKVKCYVYSNLKNYEEFEKYVKWAYNERYYQE